MKYRICSNVRMGRVCGETVLILANEQGLSFSYITLLPKSALFLLRAVAKGEDIDLLLPDDAKIRANMLSMLDELIRTGIIEQK